MLPTKHKADQACADQATKRGLSVVEDMFMCETLQFEAELEAEELPPCLLPLETAMALAAQEEAKPLHKLSPVRIFIIFNLLFCRITLTCCSLGYYLKCRYLISFSQLDSLLVTVVSPTQFTLLQFLPPKTNLRFCIILISFCRLLLPL